MMMSQGKRGSKCVQKIARANNERHHLVTTCGKLHECFPGHRDMSMIINYVYCLLFVE